LHGTNQAPNIFRQFICESIAQGYSPVVGLEISDKSLQAVRDAVGKSMEQKEIVKNLSSSDFWMKGRDGKSSIAYLQMIITLLDYEKQRKILLIGFDERVTGREEFGDLARNNLLKRRNMKKAQYVILAGNQHAYFDTDTNSISESFAKKEYRVTSLIMAFSGGQAWVCRQGACGISEAYQTQQCLSHENAPEIMERIDKNRLSAKFCLGNTTASLPATDIMSTVSHQ
jgi:hypothetical protein